MTDSLLPDRTPTQVALYTNATDPPRKIAEFRYTEQTGVTVETLDTEWADVPNRYMTNGVDLLGQQRMVRPSEGTLFMRALLQPFPMSYYTLRDES